MEFPQELFERMCKAQKVVVLTGAGVSAESGVKTFRDPDGFWAKLNPQELASVEGFLSNPNLVWSWYQQRREVIYSVKPNPGHYALAEMENLFPEFLLVTQNVDRLHQAAGSKKVCELHGNIIENKCFDCGAPYEKEIDLSSKEPPRCEICGGRVRPNVVWFGESLPIDALNAAQNAAADCDLFFSIGTSAQVYPAADLPLQALRAGAFVVEINPNETVLTPYASLSLRGPSGKVLPELLDKFKKFVGK